MNKILLIAALLWTAVLFPQSQAANWYFGYGAGLKFNLNQGTVIAVNDGRLSTNEGCASISDEDGELLFYTDGTTVYSKDHSVMQNGVGLYGDASSSQSAIIAPKPGSDTLFYIFTVDNNLDRTDNGLNYSIVDMSMDNGLGAIVEKNISLLNKCSEKITVVQKDCISGSFWLVTFASESGDSPIFDTYHAFELNENGVQRNSIKSTFEFTLMAGGVTDLRGYLVLSPDGSKLASANMRDGLYLYDFDNETGIVSNQIKLQLDVNGLHPYGVAFSPNNQFLYCHSSNDYFNRENPSETDNPVNHSSVLTQFDVFVPSEEIQSTAVIIDNRQLYRGGLQLGPDGKIYRALSASYNIGLPYLGVINSPNTKGNASNYRHNAISVAPNTSAQGLPPFIQSIFNLKIDIIQNGESASNLSLCNGESYVLAAERLPNASYSWTKDGIQIGANSNELEIDSEGHYELYINPNNGDCPLEGEAYVQLLELPESFDAELFQCDIDGTNDGLTIFNLNEAIHELTDGKEGLSVSFYTSMSEAQSDIGRSVSNDYRNIENPETLIAKVMNSETGCASYSKLRLESTYVNLNTSVYEVCDDDGNEDGFYTFDLASETILDISSNSSDNLSIAYYSSAEDALLERNPIQGRFTNTNPHIERLYARVEDGNSCMDISEIELIVNELPDIVIEEEMTYCLNFFPDELELTAGVITQNTSDFNYQWSTGETTATISVNEVGQYWVDVYNAKGCSKRKTITIRPSNIASITTIEVEDATSNNTILVSVAGEGDYEFALDNENGPYQDDNLIQNVLPGLHTVYVRDKNDCGIVSNLVSVIGFPKFFTPNNDGINDRWQVKGISPQFQPNTTIFIYDRFGKLLKELNPLSEGWDGTFAGSALTSSDYWFSVLLEDGREFKGHFSLRR